MNKRERYVEALRSLGQWVTIAAWGDKVCEMFPDLLEESEIQASEQKQDTTGRIEINARLSSYLASGRFPEVEVDESVRPKMVRFISKENNEPTTQ